MEESLDIKNFASLLTPLEKLSKTKIKNDSNAIDNILLRNKMTSFDCIFKTFSDFSDKYVNCKQLRGLESIDVKYANETISGCMLESSVKTKNCVSFGSGNLSLINAFFHNFYVNFWLKSQYIN
jgi:hypothetical protein